SRLLVSLERRDERVPPAVRRPVEDARGVGERRLGRGRAARGEGAPVDVDRDTVALLVAASSEVRGEEEPRRLDDRQDLIGPTVLARVEGTRRHRKSRLRRAGRTGDIGVALLVDGDPEAAVVSAAAEEGRVAKRGTGRIDPCDERVDPAVLRRVEGATRLGE